MRAGLPTGWKKALRGERGALLVGLIIAVTIMLVFSSVGLQKWSMTIQRDNEEELIFRGKQIAFAIRLWQSYNGAVALTDLELLEKPTGTGGGTYVLRRPFKDPMTKDGKWDFIYRAPQGGVVTAEGVSQTQDQDSEAGLNQVGTSSALQPIASTMGLPIIGVRSKSDRAAIGPARWRGGQKYNEWWFTIDDVNTVTQPIPPGSQASPPQALPGGPTPGRPVRPTRPGARPGDPFGGGPPIINPRPGGSPRRGGGSD